MAQTEDVLRRVQETLGQLQSLMGEVAKEDRLNRENKIAPADRVVSDANSIDLRSRLLAAQTMLSVAAARDKVFGPGYFFDPAWHMLLELYIASCLDGEISTSALCIASRSPQTTGLRWIAVLEKDGLINKRSDQFDKRRTFIELSKNGLIRVERTLDLMIASQKLLNSQIRA